MPDYQTRIQTLTFGGMDFRIRSLLDRQQYADPDGHAERAGIPPAHWSLFGQIWPAGRLLAEAMASHAGDGKRIRELGCGLGLASLVLQRRGADIVASDVHPLAETFLAYNAALNGLPALAYRTLRWDAPGNGLGRFDLIIASDVLYERGHASLLVELVCRLATSRGEVLLADPGRGNSNAFNRALRAQGYAVDEQRRPLDGNDAPPFRGRVIHYRRGVGETGGV
jgi:Predicted methyltransferase